MVLRKLGVLIFTLIEVQGLIVWLAAQDRAPTPYGVLALAGLTWLLNSLFWEHVVTDNVLHGRGLLNLRFVPLRDIFIFSLIETGIWGAWLVIYEAGYPIAAMGFLFVALFFEHTISRNVHERRPIFARPLFEPRTILHTVVETGSCQGWLVLVRSAQPVIGAGVLLIGSIVEHLIAVSRTNV